MFTKIDIYALLSALLLLMRSTAFCEETNEVLTLFGIAVTNTQTSAEKLFQNGCAYLSGDGVEQDRSKAVDCFRKAAGRGHPQAQFNLGICYMNGNGVDQSDLQAAEWLRQAAEQGVDKALYPLGICHHNMEQYTEAYAWALLAESKGDGRLREMLAPMYSDKEIAAGKKRFEEQKKAMEQKTEPAAMSTTPRPKSAAD